MDAKEPNKRLFTLGNEGVRAGAQYLAVPNTVAGFASPQRQQERYNLLFTSIGIVINPPHPGSTLYNKQE